MFSGHKVVCYCNITIFGVITPSRPRDLNISRFFLVSEALLRCRIVVVAKLKNGRVPSTDFLYRYYSVKITTLNEMFIINGLTALQDGVDAGHMPNLFRVRKRRQCRSRPEEINQFFFACPAVSLH